MILKVKGLKPEDERVCSFTDKPFGNTIEVHAHKRSCFFCEHCTDIYWDYTNGPYMFFCDKDEDQDDGVYGRCKAFKESENDI